MPEWSFNDESSQQAWHDVSACYANNCSSDVNTGDRIVVFYKNDLDVFVDKVYYECEGGQYVRFEEIIDEYCRY